LKKHIPNFITTLNLFSGCTGIILALQYRIDYAAYFIAIAALFDFLDGMAARLLHVKSDIGKELDSLADVVSFGVLPGIIIYQLMAASPNTPSIGSYIQYYQP
jgi:CDP-diacylglycerol--serine O-phosphatidyltransferase